MTLVVSLLLLMSLMLIAVGFGLLFAADRDGLREFSPAELSTSAPVVRGCWTRVQALAGQARRFVPARPRRPAAPREAVLEIAEISAACRLFSGHVSELLRSRPG
ncbi:hypothetical protein [Nannocystis sp.]|uniref:hypothetical protein n=1 Tax=Nannocystis sp. TaxID=1962667 RepID=UPI002420B176|nr:hypothetical protein [Nannocystis sp.]MBK7827052.1 hypothetical protein [Nannocystis sp.]MBK9755911.1 hypothetical protein [Nannocystis sp.]